MGTPTKERTDSPCRGPAANAERGICVHGTLAPGGDGQRGVQRPCRGDVLDSARGRRWSPRRISAELRPVSAMLAWHATAPREHVLVVDDTPQKHQRNRHGGIECAPG